MPAIVARVCEKYGGCQIWNEPSWWLLVPGLPGRSVPSWVWL